MSKIQSFAALPTCKLLALVLTSIFIAGSAAAQTHAPRPVASTVSDFGAGKPGGTTITYKQKTNYDFDDEEVDGTLIQPDTDLVTGRLKATHDSLVRARTTFQPEMLKSVESM
jgi:hypothetical protein